MTLPNGDAGGTSLPVVPDLEAGSPGIAGRRSSSYRRSARSALAAPQAIFSRRVREGMAKLRDWRDPLLERLRGVITNADPDAIEEVKWRKPSNPAGVPVWSDEGMICIGEKLKNAVRLTFPRGAEVDDPRKLFNARLDSKSVRAVDFHEGEPVDEPALRRIVREAVQRNRSRARRR